MLSVRVPLFHPKRSTFHFDNSFTGTMPLPSGDSVPLADYGLCGGMTFGARDFHEAGFLPPPDTTVPGPGSSLFTYLFNRQVDSLPATVVQRYHDLSNPLLPDHDTSVLGVFSPGRAHMMIVDEWPLVKADLDAGSLSALGLIKVKGPNIWKNHQVLAWGYDLEGTQLVLHLYDPNHHDTDVTLSLDLGNPAHTTPVSSSVAASDGPVLMFFHSPYAMKLPGANPVPRRALDAVCTSLSPPTGVTIGRSGAGTVRMLNVGTQEWTAAKGIALVVHPPLTLEQAAPVPATAPGEEAQLEYVVTVPLEPAQTYELSCQLRAPGLGLFGDAATADVEVTRRENEAFFIEQEAPTTLRTRERATVSVTLANLGNGTWQQSTQHRLGSQSPQDTLRWGTSRVELPKAIGPSQAAVFTFEIVAPWLPGTYAFQWRMVQDGVEWFGDSTPTVQIHVRFSPRRVVVELLRRAGAVIPTRWLPAAWRSRRVRRG